MSKPYEHISVSSDHGVLVLTIVPDRVTEYQLAEAMGRELLDEVKKQQTTKVIVDMGHVSFLSSVGYGPLVSLRAYVRQHAGRVALCNLNEVVKETFDATRLLINPRSPNSLFEFADDLPSAIALLSGQP